VAVNEQQARPKLTLERSLKASVGAVWELWTTSAGIESWWGPDGFEVKVRTLDLRPQGELRYSMKAVGADQIDYMKKAGMPLATDHRVTFTEIVPQRRLAYLELADFIPGVEAYEVATLIELEPTATGSRLILTFDAMHDDRWTRLAVMGRESELDRLSRLLEA
jgi:uncharacterized protein YndB with AHSA1/START domain